MRRLTLTVVAVACSLSIGMAGPARRAPIRVLFIGNSFTYYNNVPCMVAQLGASRGRAIETSMLAEGGASLADHWSSAATKSMLAKGWDAVVLQTQSTFGVTYLVDGLDRISDTSSLLRDARQFAEAVKEQGTRVVLFEHWKRRLAPERDQAAIHAAFGDAAGALGASVAPAGLAWELAGRKVNPALLYDTDGAHPSASGSYLAALTLYATLTGDGTKGLPSTLTCPEIDGAAEKETPSSATSRIDPDVVERLQEAAAEALRSWKNTQGVHVPPIDRPALPRAEPLRPADLEGTWIGTTNLYPRAFRWPASMTLDFQAPTSARLTISFGGKPEDIVRDVTVSVSGNTIRFEDSQGPNKTTIVYRGVRRGRDLIGTAEFAGNPALQGVAAWTLRRE